MTKVPFWEESYARPGRLDTFGGGKPSPEVVELAARLAGACRVLDLGCGEGRNALYLARLGHKTYASDTSETGIAKLRSVIAEQGLEVEATVCDMRSYALPEGLDLLVCHGCLHLLPREDWRALIPRLKACTKPGGYHTVGCFTDSAPEPPDQRGLMVGLFKEGELAEQYADWEILSRDDRIWEHEHPGGPRHKHASNSLVARKPSTSMSSVTESEHMGRI